VDRWIFKPLTALRRVIQAQSKGIPRRVELLPGQHLWFCCVLAIVKTTAICNDEHRELIASALRTKETRERGKASCNLYYQRVTGRMIETRRTRLFGVSRSGPDCKHVQTSVWSDYGTMQQLQVQVNPSGLYIDNFEYRDSRLLRFFPGGHCQLASFIPGLPNTRFKFRWCTLAARSFTS
jgi:hypothetical protein